MRKYYKNNKGVTLVEIGIAIVILTLAIIPLINMFGRAMQGVMGFGDSTRALQLANDLMEEIKSKKWDRNEPAGGGATPIASRSPIGTDGAETTNKTTWDDIDDYDVYDTLPESPPLDNQGNIITGAEKFIRRVTVRYVDVPTAGGTVTLAGNGMGTGGANPTTDFKQITITVSWPGYRGAAFNEKDPVRVTTICANVWRWRQ